MYYDLSKVLSYSNSFLYFLLGERGVGKTYGASKFVIKKFIEKGEEFVYIRRYKTELQISAPKFFEALKTNNEFEGHTLDVKGEKFYVDGKVAGYSMTLSTAQNRKGSNFPKVKYIIFDEFIIEEGQNHYLNLKNEVETFLGLIESIARMRDVKVFLLANAVTITNPYFTYFDLHLPYNNDIATFKDGLILVQYMKNEEYRKAKKETKFGKLIEGTDYASYAIDNQFRLDNKHFIQKKTGGAKCRFSFIYNNQYYGVWFDYNEGKVFVSNDYDKKGVIFACTTPDLKPNTLFISMAKDYHAWKLFIKNYKMGNVYYENQKIKSICGTLFKILSK